MKKLLVLLLVGTAMCAQTKITNKILIPYRAKNLWGLSDTLGHVLVKPFAKEIKQFIITTDGKYLSRYVVKINKTYSVIDKNKTVFLPETNTYDSIALHLDSPNHFWVYKKGKVGLFTKGKELIPCQYTDIELTGNNSYQVTKNELMGLINNQGKLIIPIQYTSIYPSWDAADEKNPKYVWVAKGLYVEKKFYDVKTIKTNYDDLPMLGEKVMVEELEEAPNYEAIKKELKTLYDKVSIDTQNSVAYVEINQKKGVYDYRNKKEIITPLYDEVEPFALDRGLMVFKVKSDAKYGLVKQGSIKLTETDYDNIIHDRQYGIYLLIKNDKKGMIVFNTIYPIIPPKYTDIKPYGAVQINDHWQFGLYTVKTEQGTTGYLGENGVEFFRD